MARKEHYQRMAGHCLRLAQHSGDATNRALLLEMAQTWVKLAEQVQDSEIDVLQPDTEDE